MLVIDILEVIKDYIKVNTGHMTPMFFAHKWDVKSYEFRKIAYAIVKFHESLKDQPCRPDAKYTDGSEKTTTNDTSRCDKCPYNPFAGEPDDGYTIKDGEPLDQPDAGEMVKRQFHYCRNDKTKVRPFPSPLCSLCTQGHKSKNFEPTEEIRELNALIERLQEEANAGRKLWASAQSSCKRLALEVDELKVKNERQAKKLAKITKFSAGLEEGYCKLYKENKQLKQKETE